MKELSIIYLLIYNKYFIVQFIYSIPDKNQIYKYKMNF